MHCSKVEQTMQNMYYLIVCEIKMHRVNIFLITYDRLILSLMDFLRKIEINFTGVHWSKDAPLLTKASLSALGTSLNFICVQKHNALIVKHIH